MKTVFRNDTEAETFPWGGAPGAYGQPRSFIAGMIREESVLVIALLSLYFSYWPNAEGEGSVGRSLCGASQAALQISSQTLRSQPSKQPEPPSASRFTSRRGRRALQRPFSILELIILTLYSPSAFTAVEAVSKLATISRCVRP